jgi:ADP-dependent phosphofructokinase/glucokinase
MTMTDTSLNGEAKSDTSNRPIADQAWQVAQDLKDKASDVAASVTHTAHQEADEIGTAAQEILTDATDKVSAAVSEQKNAGADYLDTVARAIHRAAREFETDVPQAAQYIRRAGGQLGSVAQAVRQRDMRELVTEVENLARRQPSLFFGGAVILGFAALRFLKSSPPKSVEASPH